MLNVCAVVFDEADEANGAFSNINTAKDFLRHK